MSISSFRITLLVAVYAALVHTVVSAPATADSSAGTSPAGGPAVRLTGLYVEVCTCERLCEAALCDAGRPGPCAFVAAIKVEAGQKGEVSLAGLAAALVAPDPAAEGKGASSPALYVDRSANPAQAEVLRAVLGERLAARAGVTSLPAPRAAAVRVGRTSDAITLEVEGVAEIRARPIYGAFRRTVQVENAPGTLIPFPSLARGVAGQVADPTSHVRFDADGRSVLYGKFDFGASKGKR